MNLDSVLQERLLERQQQALLRQRHTVLGSQQPVLQMYRANMDNKQQDERASYLSFTSNDYLGLAAHPHLQQVMTQAIKKYGVGSGASHLVCGHSDIHSQLEVALAKLTGRSRAVLFSSGYMANVGAIGALVQSTDGVFQDRLNHASLLDGGRLSGARMQRYHHTDIADLQKRLQHSQCRHRLVVTDTVFSMDGNMAPLNQLAILCQQEQAWLMLDDAHGLGVLGPNGGGSALHFGLDEDMAPVYMGTLGKALGCYGAFIAGSDAMAEAMVQFSRSYIYTTALPPAIAAATLGAIHLLQEEAWRQQKLQALIEQFLTQAQALQLPLLPSQTAIQPVLVGDAQQAVNASNALQRKGILVTAIRPPTVPNNSARLRITITAGHSESQIEQLVSALGELQKEGYFDSLTHHQANVSS